MLGARSIQVTGNIKFDITAPDGTKERAEELAQTVRRPVRLSSRQHTGRRRGSDPGHLSGDRHSRPAAGHRAAPPAALRRSGGTTGKTRCGVFQTQPAGTALPAHTRGLSGRQHGRDGGLLLGRQRRLHRRQPVATGRTEPDRSGGGGLPGIDRSAHLEFSGSHRTGHRGRGGETGCRCRRRWRAA